MSRAVDDWLDNCNTEAHIFMHINLGTIYLVLPEIRQDPKVLCFYEDHCNPSVKQKDYWYSEVEWFFENKWIEYIGVL